MNVNKRCKERRFTFRLPASDLELLDYESSLLNINKSHFIRNIINYYLTRNKDEF
jgi:predicted DNA binding CopG/RHH family protein